MTSGNFCALLAVLPLVSSAVCASGQPLPGAEVQVQTSAAGDATPTYRERHRPQYHFTPALNWMNDPNGMVYYDGEYHLFYQHNPFGKTWGHMSWGHAVSPDLVHWEHLSIAIPEANGVMAFSGSAVVDWNNTSGFGRDGRPPLVAIYTAHQETNQSQHIAYSNDRGRTWSLYDGNPVLDIGRKDFRDPKVFWHEPQRRWVMVVALPDQHKVSFYSSPDLKQWTHLSDFGPAAAVGGIWECPDLFELRVDGAADDARWVLIVSLNPGSISGGSGMQYFVGRFDGTRFTAESPAAGIATAGMPLDSVMWADYGKDFYAAVSWSDVPREDGRRLWLGWMNNWQYAQEIPTSPWRSAQSLPRTLALKTTSRGVRLVQQPVTELQQLRGPRRTLAGQVIGEGSTSLASQGIAGTALEIVAEFEAGTAAELGLKVRTGDQEETVIGLDPRAGQLFLDRTRSGQVDFHPEFSGRHTAPLPVDNGRVRLHVFVDSSSIEVFAANGQVVVTDQIFPAPESDGVALYARGGAARLVSLDAWPLDSIWRKELAAPPGPLFRFHTDEFWLNLHHFLYVLGRAEAKMADATREAVVGAPADARRGLATLASDERNTWRDAVAFYAAGPSHKDAIFDSQLPKIAHALAEVGERPDLSSSASSIDAELRATLERAAPMYRKGWWLAHRAANLEWRDAVQAHIDRHGEAVLAFITRAYGMEWPPDGFPVYLSGYANWAGAYSTVDNLLVISSLDRDTRGLSGLETVFHEAMHQWDGPIQQLLSDHARRAGRHAPSGLSHALIWVTAGEAVRRVAPGYLPNVDRLGIWQRGMQSLKEPIEAVWKPYLNGQGTRDEAFAALIAHF